MSNLATLGFKQQMKQQWQMSVEALRETCLELGVNMTACQMTVDMMGLQKDDFIDGVEFAGAPSYFAQTPDTQSLFI